MRWHYLCLVLGGMFTCNAFAYDLLLDIRGAISSNGCMVSTNSQNMLIEFDNVATKQFYTNQTPWAKKKFIISLESCGADTTGVKVGFKGSPHPDNNDFLALMNMGEPGFASGLGIEILDSVDTTLPINGIMANYKKITPGLITYLEFSAQYRSTGRVTVGKANGIATFILEYE